MSNLILISEQEEEVVRRSDPERTIIASSPWVKGNGECPNRVVLRTNGKNGYIVHRQMVSSETGNTIASFFWGHYFPKEEDALAKAWMDFEETSRKHLVYTLNGDIRDSFLAGTFDAKDDERAKMLLGPTIYNALKEQEAQAEF